MKVFARTFGRAGEIQLHGANAIAHFKGEPGRQVECHMVRDLAEDGGKFRGLHVGAVFMAIQQLHENFRPCFRISAAVERGELTALDLGNVVAGTDGASVIVEHQWAFAVGRECGQQAADGHLGLGRVKEHWRGIGVTLFINWGVKPFSMALLGWHFVGHLFRPLLPADQIESYIAGLILLAAAPCTAMLFVWSNLTKGEPHFTLSQVALNDTSMVFAFAPIVALLLGLSAITVPWATLVLSVVLYIVVPVLVAQAARMALLARGGIVEIGRASCRERV